jgi:predicted DNA-binding transcriptional regulator AlpA
MRGEWGRELVTGGDVAEMLGVTPGRVWQLAREGSLPEPVGTLRGGRRVWRRVDIERWLAHRQRR